MNRARPQSTGGAPPVGASSVNGGPASTGARAANSGAAPVKPGAGAVASNGGTVSGRGRKAAAMVGVSLVLAAATGAIAQATATTGPTSRTIEVTARFSAFTPEALVVEAGTHVTFVIDNADPIAHEFIVGDEDLHRRHATGTEVWHAPRPGEVSIPAGGRAETTWRFDRPGTVAFGCHLPGHWAYGMSGVITVV